MRFVLASVISGIAMFSAQASGVGGQKAIPFKPNGQRVNVPVAQARKNVPHTANMQIARELEAVRALLNKANHDYNGHRAAAVHEVTHAIHILEHGKHHPNPGNHFIAAQGRIREPQQVSDVQLQQAILALQTIAVQLHGTNGQHHTQAALVVKKAIYNLHVALKVA